MANAKFVKALEALVVLGREAMDSHALARRLGVSRPTAVRLVEELRELGCRIDAEREGSSDWAYHLVDWGVFDRGRVPAVVRKLKGAR